MKNAQTHYYDKNANQIQNEKPLPTFGMATSQNKEHNQCWQV